MGLTKLRTSITSDEEGDIGIGTLIIFIAIVLVAAIAASLILYAAALLQQQAQKTVDEAVREISGGLEIINIAGDRNPDGADSTVVAAIMPQRDTIPPEPGVLLNVTATRDGQKPLGIVLNWSSATDYGSGLAAEIIYRTAVYDPTNPDYYNEEIARNRLQTLDMLGSAHEVARFDSGFGPARQYVDYTVRDDNSTSYAYAIVGIDRAGNMVLYTAIDSSASTDDTTRDEDVIAPTGGSMTNTVRPDDYSVTLFWVPASDSGSGVLEQKLYRSEAPVAALQPTLIQGRTVLIVPSQATLVATLDATASSYTDNPPSTNRYYYFIVTTDRSGNEAFSGTLSASVLRADTAPPKPVSGLSARQAFQSVLLTWETSSDAETGVDEYRVYRSSDNGALDSVEELLAASPLAVLGPQSTSYADYSGSSGAPYYYTVVAVDAAGNLAEPVIPSNGIQMLEIKVKTRPGSDPVLFTTMMIEVTDGVREVTLAFNSLSYGPAGADGNRYSVDILRDPDGVFNSTKSLSDGALVKIYINTGAIGFNLPSDSWLSLKFIPDVGLPVVEEVAIPYIGNSRYVTLI